MANGKSKMSKKSTKARAGVAKTSRASVARPNNPSFGAVSTITTAPVAIGNSMTGFQSQVLHTATGAKVVGRDFGFTPIATGTATGWMLTGGMPLTPSCMPSTILRNFCQMYNKFKFLRCAFHYITSSSTTTTGDVVFYYQKNSESQMCEWTNNSFLPFVLSDSQTVIGPQWTNHTVLVTPTGGFKSTDYGVSIPTSVYAHGDIHLFSKTSSTESPGYVIFDYEIEFKELSVNPRAGFLPVSKAQWNEVSLIWTQNVTAGTTISKADQTGTSGVGGTTIVAPVTAIGDIYKLIIDVTSSTLGANTAANMFMYNVGDNTTETFTLKDGTVVYAVVSATTVTQFFETEAGAYGQGSALKGGFTVSPTNAVMRGFWKFIGSVNPAVNASQY